MKFYPLNINFFANLSVSASVADTALFTTNTAPLAKITSYPTGPKGETGTSGGKIFLLSSSLLVCAGSPAPTPTAVILPTPTPSWAALSPTPTPSLIPPTPTPTATQEPICSGFCESNADCSPGCTCGPRNKCGFKEFF